jgi:hypothetical protein
MAQARFGTSNKLAIKFVKEPAWDLSYQSFYNGIVYKTHGLAHELPRNTNVKLIFVYDIASNAAISVLSCLYRYGDNWIKKHLEHLRANGNLNELTQQDILRFNDQLEGWIHRTDISRLFIKYQSIWKYKHILDQFCGFNIDLPPKQTRHSFLYHSSDTINQLKYLYNQLDQKIDQMPECKQLDIGETL